METAVPVDYRTSNPSARDRGNGAQVDIHQLKTFVTVAREGSVTRASSLLNLSQPAVSAHVKAMEDEFGVALFERTSRGMSLTHDGQRLLSKVDPILEAYRGLMEEATRIKGSLIGKLSLGVGSNSKNEAVGKLLAGISERCPEVAVNLEHVPSRDILAGIRNGSLDAGFYNEPGEPDPDLAVLEVSRFTIFVVAPVGLAPEHKLVDWRSLAELPWIYPVASACCGWTAERLFRENQVRPRRIISVDREDVTKTLVASGTGVGLLHADSAREAEARGDVSLLFECPTPVRVLFAYLANRANDPILASAISIIRGS